MMFLNLLIINYLIPGHHDARRRPVDPSAPAAVPHKVEVRVVEHDVNVAGGVSVVVRVARSTRALEYGQTVQK